MYLVYGEFLEFRTELKLLNPDDLDGHSLAVLFVDRLVHLAELSLPDDVVQHVIFYLFAHRKDKVSVRYYNSNNQIKSTEEMEVVLLKTVRLDVDNLCFVDSL